MTVEQISNVDVAAASRPREIEQWSNLYLIHPLSIRVAKASVRAGIGPNTVSAAGAVCALCAAVCFAALNWPWAALAGFMLLVATHVFDGADGLVARATNTASLTGASIDGMCDAITLLASYLALGWLCFQQSGFAVMPVIAIALVSNIVHANAFEGRRALYMKWIYSKDLGGAERDRTLHTPERKAGGLRAVARRLYEIYYTMFPYEARQLSRQMQDHVGRDGDVAEAARRAYRTTMSLDLRLLAVLGQNHKTMAIGVAMLAGQPLYFFIYVAVVINIAFVSLALRQAARDRDLAGRLQSLA